MALDLLKERGVPLDRQRFTWRDMVQRPISKLDADAFTRIRIILMNGIEQERNRFGHAMARMFGDFREPLAMVRRVEHHQQTMVNWLLSADHTPLETTIAYEQVAIEVTASVAEAEPDEYLAAIYRFGLLEDFDHLYRFSALMDRVEGKDANAILQGYTDVVPGRPTSVEHRHPLDDLRRPYRAERADLLSKLHAWTITAGENQTRDYYMTIGPMFADPMARQLYAEIASIEEQHVTQYESLTDPRETPLEKWLIQEATEAYNYWSCAESESDGRLRAVWERFLDYELGHVQLAAQIFEDVERRDAAEVIDGRLRHPLKYEPHREFVREVLRHEVDLGAYGHRLVHREDEPDRTRIYRAHMNSQDSPSNLIAGSWVWKPGGELSTNGVNKAKAQAVAAGDRGK